METSMEKFDISEPPIDYNQPKHRSLFYKILKTFCIILIWIGIGLWSEGNGAMLQDLRYMTDANVELISRAISMRGAGGLCGALLGGGYLVDRYHSKVELIVAVALVVCAALNVAIPYSPHIEALFAIFLMEGWAEALINIGGQIIIMDIWKERASAPLHIIHLGYGVGSFIAPQIVKNFISDELLQSDSVNAKCSPVTSTSTTTSSLFDVNSTLWNNTDLNITTTTTIATTTSAGGISSTFQYGFIIISGIIAVIAIIWFLYFFVDKKEQDLLTEDEKVKDKTSFREIFNLNTCAPGDPFFALILYILIFFWIFVAVAGERIGAKYLFSYAREVQCFNKDEASNILTAYWVSFTVGRFIGFVAGNFIPMKFIILVEGIGNLANAVVLFFFAANQYVLWVCVCVAGVLIGPCYPSGLAWANRYMIITATGVTVLSVGAGVSDLSFLSTIGFFVERMGIQVMTSFFLGYGVVVCVLMLIMQGVARTRGDRFEKQVN